MAIREEIVTFGSQGAELSGTLLLPTGGGQCPAVVSLHGSGREDRTYNLSLGHYFAEAGIAWLAYDKRGVGESTGDWFHLADRPRSFHTLAEDALAGLRVLSEWNEIDEEQVGIWGASQGGYVGVLATAQCDNVAFLICVSTPGVDTDRQMAYAISRALEARGFGPLEIEDVLRRRERCLELLTSVALNQVGVDELQEFVQNAMESDHHEFVVPRGWIDKGDIGTSLGKIVEAERSRPGYVYDPKPYLERVGVPLLAVFGENDDLVPVEESKAAIRQALVKAGNERFEMKTFPGADHNLRLPSGREVLGYVDLMVEWLSNDYRINP